MDRLCGILTIVMDGQRCGDAVKHKASEAIACCLQGVRKDGGECHYVRQFAWQSHRGAMSLLPPGTARHSLFGRCFLPNVTLDPSIQVRAPNLSRRFSHRLLEAGPSREKKEKSPG